MHAIITGGSSGIGLATARGLARQGAAVSLIARGADRLAEASSSLAAAGAVVDTAAADVADADALSSAVDQLVAEHGPCDVLVTSAGIARPGHFLELGPETFRQQMDINYFGTLNAVRAVAPEMVTRRRGSIVTVSSAAGLVGIFGYTAYTPTKYAVRGFSESLRAELAPHGVHVGCVFPPDVDTPQLEEENRHKPAETKAISGTVKPLTPEAVADCILDGIARRRFWMIPDPTTKLLARAGGLIRGPLAKSFDRKAASVRR